MKINIKDISGHKCTVNNKPVGCRQIMDKCNGNCEPGSRSAGGNGFSRHSHNAKQEQRDGAKNQQGIEWLHREDATHISQVSVS